MNHRQLVNRVSWNLGLSPTGLFIKAYRHLYPILPESTLTHNAMDLYRKYQDTGQVKDEDVLQYLYSLENGLE